MAARTTRSEASVVDIAPQALRPAAPALLLEAAFLRRGGRRRRLPATAHLHRSSELLEDPLGSELAVPKL